MPALQSYLWSPPSPFSFLCYSLSVSLLLFHSFSWVSTAMRDAPQWHIFHSSLTPHLLFFFVFFLRWLSQVQKYRMTTTAFFSGQLFCILYAWFMFLKFSSEISFSAQTLESCSAFQNNMLTNLQLLQNSLPWMFRTTYWNETDLLCSGS